MVPYKLFLKYTAANPRRWLPVFKIAFALLLKQKKLTLFSDGIYLQCGLAGGQGVWCALTGLDYEVELNQFLSFLKPNDVVCDVGANIGTYAIRAAFKIAPGGHVYAFEPLKENQEMLLNSISQNQAKNITVIGSVVGDENGTVSFSSNGRNSSAKISADNQRDAKILPIITLDSFAEEYQIKRLDWIKMDIEGAEPLVLKGIPNCIERFKPSFLFENHEGGAETCKILSALKYKIGVFNKGAFIESDKSENLFAIHPENLK
jgi:FkbM family methyltransferase